MKLFKSESELPAEYTESVAIGEQIRFRIGDDDQERFELARRLTQRRMASGMLGRMAQRIALEGRDKNEQ